jgi:RNA-directed DNA polymerase
MSLDRKMPQMSRTGGSSQVEPRMKSAAGPTCSGEARSATQDTGCLGASDLMERVLARPNLQAALKRVRQNKGSPGIDGMSVEQLPDYLREHWPALRERLLVGSYQPQAVRRHLIPKSDGGVRQLGIPSGLDRFLQQALLQVLQPLIDPSFSRYSYGFRPGRSAHEAILAAQRYIQDGHCWVVDVDLEQFFDRVNHDVLMGKLAARIADRRVLGYLVGWRQYFRLADTPRVFRRPGSMAAASLAGAASEALETWSRYFPRTARSWVVCRSGRYRRRQWPSLVE